jgi:hypothetical protein
MIVLILSSQSFLSYANPDFHIKSSPKWKTKIGFDPGVSGFENKGSISYLLLDWQENEITKEYNYRYCIRLNNEDGVQNNSQLYFNFYPNYQELGINKITIHRNGKTINKLKRDKIEIMRNEKQTDRFLYNESYSAVAILDDIRVGDILEYEYTIKGSNPLFKNHVYSFISQAYSSEVGHLYQEMIVSDHKKLQINNLFNGQVPKIERINGVDHLIWDYKGVKAILQDDDVPPWFDSFPATEVSSYGSWNDVKKFMGKLYPENVSSAKIKKLIADRGYRKNEEGIIGMIRFVQDEIRYLSMSSGINSHKPHQPEQVFSQRFGDCKDKSYLLSVMLRMIGVEAWPAVVSTKHMHEVGRYVPSPFAFNHVIVKFRWNGKDYWLDPTANNEKGVLDQLKNPLYGKALVLDKESTGLEPIPVNQERKVIITEHLWFTDSTSKARYEVESKFFGEMANIKRNAYQNASMQENMDGYLDYCNQFYNGMSWQSNKGLSYVDDTIANTFTSIEKYHVENMWEHRGKDTIELYTSVFPYNMYEFLSTSDDRLRKMPMTMKYPVDVDLTIQLHFPPHKTLSFDVEKDSIINDAFRFEYCITHSNITKTVSVNYKYKSLKIEVPADKTKSYFKDYNKLSESCEYAISWGMDVDRGFRLFVPALVISLLFAVAFFYLLKKLYNWEKNLVIKLPYTRNSIGGWLIIVGGGLYLTPFVIGYFIYDSGYFNEITWQLFMDSYGEQPFLTGGLIFFELMFNLAVIFSAVFLIVLMHQKRATFPKLYIYFRVAILVGLILDTVLCVQLLGVEVAEFKDLFRAIIGAAIWIPYMLNSERVRETFVRAHPQVNKIE